MLSEAERKAVADAVRQAETKTRGEIYCVLARESSSYGETPLAAGAIAALAGPALLLLLGVEVSVPELFVGEWSAAQIGAAAEAAARGALTGAIILQVLLFAAAALIAAVGPIRTLLTPGPVKRARVLQRAEQLFLAKNLHLTRERTGVLIYVSARERMAEILADDGIDAVTDAKVWDEALAALTAGMRRKAPAEGFVDAVAICGRVLAEHFPADRKDNPNELPDAVVVLER